MKNEKKHSGKTRSKQGPPAVTPEPNKIAGSTPFDFDGKNLTPYGGRFPVATMLETLGLQKLVEEMLTVKRRPRFMSVYPLVMAVVLAIYVGFSRLNHLGFVANDPMLTGLLKVASLPGQSTCWRFCAWLHLTVARATVVGAAASPAPAGLGSSQSAVARDHCGHRHHRAHSVWQPDGGTQELQTQRTQGRKAISPSLPLSPRPANTWGELRNGDRPDGKQIARHWTAGFAALPTCVDRLFARADSGFYCGEAVRAYEQAKAQFILVARKTSRLPDQLQAAAWKPSPETDADPQCEFCHQPEGWGKAYRFVALRYQNDTPSQQRGAVSTI